MKVNFLDLIPNISDAVTWKEDENLRVIIYRENKGVLNRIAQKLLGKPKVSQIHLDEMGSRVWRMIDGRKSVADLQLEVETSYGQLAVYLRLLEQQKFVVMKEAMQYKG